MKVRSAEDLVGRLDSDLGRRKRELSSTLHLVNRARAHQIEAATKAAFCLLYAHWEGFIRNSMAIYLEFINGQGLAYSDLYPPLITICIKEKIHSIKDRRILELSDVISWFTDRSSEKASLSVEYALEHPSIINYHHVEDVILLLQADRGHYSTKKNIINEKLIRIRNSVSHGEYINVDPEEYKNTQEQIITIMDWLKTDFENAAVGALYRRTPPAR